MDKGPLAREVANLVQERQGRKVPLISVGERMYEEAFRSGFDITLGSILDMSPMPLAFLRRHVTEKAVATAEPACILSTHAALRWRHGVFDGIDFDYYVNYAPTVIVTVVDNIDSVYERLSREHNYQFSLTEVAAAREEEILAGDILAKALSYALKRKVEHVVIARGRPESHQRAVETLYRLVFEPWRLKVYTSFPMTQVWKNKRIRKEIDEFRNQLEVDHCVFDPAMVDEFGILLEAWEADAKGREQFRWTVNGRTLVFKTAEVLAVERMIIGQIISRDLRLVRQSNVIVSLVPQLKDGSAALSSGVERELHAALDSTRQVIVWWKVKAKIPSPFQSGNGVIARKIEEVNAELEKTRKRVARTAAQQATYQIGAQVVAALRGIAA